MENKFGVTHEQEVLDAFNKMTDDFGKNTPLFNEGDKEVTLVDIFGSEDADAALGGAGAVKASRSERNAAKKTAKTSRKKAEPKKTDEANQPKKKKKKKKGITFGKILLILFLLVLIACIVVGVKVGKYVLGIIKETPDINPSNIYEYLSENSVMYDRDGNFMENVYAGDALRSNVKYQDIPENLINAVVCTEDKTFWDHHGFNFVRIMGAIKDSLETGNRIGGTSTLTQQLARNIYLEDIKSKRSMERKIQEAYYTIIIEKSLTKEQILEAYLNTVYLGFNSNGIDAASHAYFNKDVGDLTLIECAILASLPQSPNSYAPIKRISTAEVTDESEYDIVSKSNDWIIYYNDGCESRVDLILKNMHDQEKIPDSEYNLAKNIEVRNVVNPGTSILTTVETTSYFADYVKEKVLSDIQTELGYSYDDARKLLYNGGLIINSTMDLTIQNIMEEEYANTDNFPSVGTYSKDKAGNILDSNNKILLYAMENIISEDGNFTLKADEFEWQSNGDLKVFNGNRLNFYKTVVGENIDYSVEFKKMFEKEEGFFYSRSGGVWNIAREYKDRTDEGDLILKAAFFKDKPNAFTKNDNGTLTLSSDYFTVADRIRQPQSAMVIENYSTGEIVGMIGGRDIEGHLLYNRATSPRQPGSSIKPLAVYSTALQAGVDGLGNFTAATPLDDAPISQGGRPWPKNWYTGYRGIINLRTAVEQSINCCAVNLYLQLDPMLCVENLQNMGISSLVTSGSVNDINASALALGGMTKGISPLEMCAAYGTFGNYGTFIEPICYTTVTNKKGDVILQNTPKKTVVMDESVASLMTDILRTTVTKGLASKAKLKSQASAGKTGTTSDRYDIWFCGLTPKYSAATWIGNDINISLNKGSDAAVAVWKAVMERVGELDERQEFEMRGDFVTATVDRCSGKLMTDLSEGISEIFIAGTVPGESDDAHKVVSVCAETGYLATPLCPATSKIAVVRPGGMSWEKRLVEYNFEALTLDAEPDAMYDAPDFYCPYHNPDPSVYETSPRFEGAIYNPSDANPVSEEGYWMIDPDTGEEIWVPNDEGAELNPEVVEGEGYVDPEIPGEPTEPGEPEEEVDIDWNW